MLVESDFCTGPTTGEASWAEGYACGELFLGFQVTQRDSPPSAIHQKDDTPVEDCVYGGVTHRIFSDLDTTIVWMIGDIEYFLWATGGAADLKAPIRSAYQVREGRQHDPKSFRDESIKVIRTIGTTSNGGPFSATVPYFLRSQ